MALNPYININNNTNVNEQSLINDFVAESIKFNGIDVVYLPRTMQKEDKLFHEDPISAFTQNFVIEAYVESFDGFEGDGDLLGAMGLTINDQVSLQFSQSRFKTITSLNRPVEGDLIYSSLSNSLFEIKFVEHEDQFYAAGTLPSFKVKCELFDFSGETFNTGISNVDSIDNMTLDAIGDNVDTTAQPFADNVQIQQEGANIVSFVETNPFGMP